MVCQFLSDVSTCSAIVLFEATIFLLCFPTWTGLLYDIWVVPNVFMQRIVIWGTWDLWHWPPWTFLNSQRWCSVPAVRIVVSWYWQNVANAFHRSLQARLHRKPLLYFAHNRPGDFLEMCNLSIAVLYEYSNSYSMSFYLMRSPLV